MEKVISNQWAVISKEIPRQCTADGEAFLVAHAAATAAGRPFDRAVLDLTIPGGMEGKDAIRHLRERDQNIHAIVSNGYSTDPVMAQCTACGFNAVLPKPYQTRDLIRVVQEYSAA